MEIVLGVTHGSILRPLLFNIFLTYLFFIISNKDIASYAGDNTPCIAADNIDDLIKLSEEVSAALFEWFDNIRLQNNPVECHLLISINENRKLKIVSVRNYLESN